MNGVNVEVVDVLGVYRSNFTMDNYKEDKFVIIALYPMSGDEVRGFNAVKIKSKDKDGERFFNDYKGMQFPGSFQVQTTNVSKPNGKNETIFLGMRPATNGKPGSPAPSGPAPAPEAKK